jgi:uracil-DNA glycosylase
MMTWEDILSTEEDKPYFKSIFRQLDEERRQKKPVYPPRNLIFNALKLTPLENVSVVILGQDPYHGPNEAHGLAFSVKEGIPIPPSLHNVFKELHNDLGHLPPKHGDLSSWAKQGVLLLNTSLSVKHKQPGSHSQIGWKQLTDTLIQKISENKPFVVFVLWGRHAHTKQSLIDARHHTILSPHPSPLSAYRGFLGSKPFSTINQQLSENQLKPINWQLIPQKSLT